MGVVATSLDAIYRELLDLKRDVSLIKEILAGKKHIFADRDDTNGSAKASWKIVTENHDSEYSNLD